MTPQNVVNPGLVNVADEAYPFIPSDYQALSFDSKTLLSASLFAPNPPPSPVPPFAPFPAPVAVASQAYVQPFFARPSFPPPPDYYVSDQSFINPLNLADYVVTDAGNFQTNATEADLVTLTISAAVIINPGSNPTIQVFFGGANLFSYGINLVGRQAAFPDQADPMSPDQIPEQPILFYSTNFIIVPQPDMLFVPAPGDLVEFSVSREGPEAVFQFLDSAPQNIFVQQIAQPIEPNPVNAQVGFFQGNFFPSTNGPPVPLPQIDDEGVPTGLYGGNPVEVANQSLVEGLPQNYFP